MYWNGVWYPLNENRGGNFRFNKEVRIIILIHKMNKIVIECKQSNFTGFSYVLNIYYRVEAYIN